MPGTGLPTQPSAGGAEADAAITCDSCQACCCRLEVLLMAGDDVPPHLTEVDRWGGQVMARLEDGWCAALDRGTRLCRIYARRPGVCRDYPVGGSDCLQERSGLPAVTLRRTA